MSESTKSTGLSLLRQPFPDHQIGKLAKGSKAQTQCKPEDKVNCNICGGWHHPKMIHLDYVGHAALTDRLLDADPNWFWEPLALKDGLPAFDDLGGLWIKLTVCGVTRLGYGNAADSEYKEIGSRQKEVIGDALRNAAMRFGAALELWHKGDLHVEDKEPETAAEAVVAANVKPTAGVMEMLPVERQKLVRWYASHVVDAFTAKDENLALRQYEEAKTQLDADEQVALRRLLPSEHKTALRKMAEERKKRTMDEMAGSQA